MTRHSVRFPFHAFLAALIVTVGASIPASAEHSEQRREALREIVRLESDMARIRSTSANEKQIPRKVEFNLELKRVPVALTAARERL